MGTAWDYGDLKKAAEKARQGYGGQLANIIKSISTQELGKGLSQSKGDLVSALAYCAGRKEMRAELKALREGGKKDDE